MPNFFAWRSCRDAWGCCQCRGRHMLAETLIREDEELILRIVSRLSIAMVCVDDLIEK